MRIGLDLDNTIINYSGIFHRVAVEKGWIPAGTDSAKNSVRGYLQDRDQNDVWTILQGLVYAPYLNYAKPYPGSTDFILRAKAAGHTLKIISHKTRVAAMGEKYDLRSAASQWLKANNIAGSVDSPLAETDVSYAETRAEKVDIIIREQCDVFVDDLPEVYAEPHFPSGCRKILFTGDGAHDAVPGAELAQTWSQVSDMILGRDG